MLRMRASASGIALASGGSASALGSTALKNDPFSKLYLIAGCALWVKARATSDVERVELRRPSNLGD
jgi:hypothetical protein